MEIKNLNVLYFELDSKLYLEIVDKIKNGTIQKNVPFIVDLHWIELQDDNTIVELKRNTEKPSIIIDILISLVNEELKRNNLKQKEEENIYFSPSQLDKLIKQYLDFL
jgi:hypothetical protein